MHTYVNMHKYICVCLSIFSLFRDMNIYIHIYVFVSIYTSVHMYTHKYSYIHVYIKICINVYLSTNFLYVYFQLGIPAHAVSPLHSTRGYKYIYTCINMNMYKIICMYIYTYL